MLSRLDGLTMRIPAIVHLALVEFTGLAVFQFSIFFFLRGLLSEVFMIVRYDLTQVIGAVSYRKFLCYQEAFVEYMWTGWLPPTDCWTLEELRQPDDRVRTAFYINILILFILLFLALVLSIAFLRTLPLSTPVSSGKYLQFLWQAKMSRSYKIPCRILEGLSVAFLVCLVLINWLLLGFEGLMFIVREKFIEAFMVLTTMRHFTRPVRPCFNFEDEWFAETYFAFPIFKNGNAIVSSLHAGFCEIIAGDSALVPDAGDTKRIRIALLGKAEACEEGATVSM